jgi:type II secretory pathway predicted ATPase ExeA
VYLDFYSLSQAPFHITPDPQFLFLSPSHKAVLATMAYGIASQQGFIAVFGDAGVGKTTLLRAYLTHVKRQELHTIFVDNADLTFDALLRLLLRELGLTATTDDPRDMVQQLQQRLAEAAHQSRHIMVVLDGAQAMPVETLTQLPRLCTLEDATGKPLHIVLVGQPELHHTLAQEALRHLEQRIAVRATILPLTRQESLAYLHHRLAHVTQDDRPIFTPAALRRIVRQARGLPRVVNTLCTNALIAGFAAQQKPITAALVQRVIADAQGGRRLPAWRLSLAPATAMALLGGLLWLAPWQELRDAPSTAPQATLAQGGDRTAQEARAIAAPTVPRQVPGVESHERAQDAQSPALLIQHSEASGEAPAQQSHTDTWAMQEPVARPETAGHLHAEQVDVQAMDKLLTGLEAADKTTVPTVPHSKAVKRRSTKSPLRAAASHGLPSFALSPQQSDTVPPRASGLRPAAVSRTPVAPLRVFNVDDPRARVNDLRSLVNNSAE